MTVVEGGKVQVRIVDRHPAREKAFLSPSDLSLAVSTATAGKKDRADESALVRTDSQRPTSSEKSQRLTSIVHSPLANDQPSTG